MSVRRRAIRLAYLNGVLWAIGNGLASTTLVIYLALDLGAEGRAISWILAAPQLVGLVRWWLSSWIGHGFGRKGFCLTCYTLSALVLLVLPWVSSSGLFVTEGGSLRVLVLLWCSYHLLEYLATVALWSWIGDMAPRAVRGRFLGRREAWMLVGRIPSTLAAGAFAFWWGNQFADSARWIGYAIPATFGAAMMLVALVPLVIAHPLARTRPRPSPVAFRWLAPALDGRFRRLLWFGCWFSFFNGVTQGAQNIYPARVLGLSLLAMLAMRTGMRLGQLAAAPGFGRLADVVGFRPLMIAGQLVVATGPLFFLLATPDSPWWVAGAFAAWTAYAALNVCLPGLMLKLAPGEDNAPHIAFYYGITGLLYGVSTIAGGELFDALSEAGAWTLGPLVVDHYALLFFIGWLTRTAAIFWLWRIVEPGAWTRREWLSARRSDVNG